MSARASWRNASADNGSNRITRRNLTLANPSRLSEVSTLTPQERVYILQGACSHAALTVADRSDRRLMKETFA